MTSIHELYKSEAAYRASMQRYDNAQKEWKLVPESIMVETRFGQTHVLRAGDPTKPSLCFFHGWNGNASGANQELNLERLAEYFCLYFPDTIGQSGKSAPSRPETEGSAYGDWIADMFDALGLTHVSVLGISGGGYLGLKACVYAANKVEKAFLMSSGGLVDLSRINIRFIISVMPAVFGFKWGGQYFIRRMVSPNFENETMIQQAGEGMRQVLNTLKPVNGPKPLSDEELRRIHCPVYIVMGEHDIAVSPNRTLQRAEKHIPNVTTKLIDAGHMMTLEKQEWLTNEMLAFFGYV